MRNVLYYSYRVMENTYKTRKGNIMTHRIFTLSENAIISQMDWDTAFVEEEIETVQEFDSYEEAVAAFEAGNYDPDLYGVG